jgi:hypothetical protein
MHHQEEDDDDDEYEEDEQHNNEAFTSIWDLVPGYTQSPLDGMIDKAGTTLEDVLDEDTLIQELKSNNQKVISLYVYLIHFHTFSNVCVYIYVCVCVLTLCVCVCV